MKEILIRLEDELYEQCKNTELTEENEGFDFHIIKSIANGTPLEEQFEKIIDKIDFEEKLLIKIKTENGFIPIVDVCNAMYRIRKTISELKGE